MWPPRASWALGMGKKGRGREEDKAKGIMVIYSFSFIQRVVLPNAEKATREAKKQKKTSSL